MILLIIFFVVPVPFALYAIWGRKWLKAKTWPWSVRYFQFIEPYEILLYKKSETLLWARFRMLWGTVFSLVNNLAGTDLTPILSLVPEKYQWIAGAFINCLPLLVSFLAWIDQRMRETSSMPTELVAVPDNPPIEVAIAVERFESAKREAIAVIAAEKQTPVVVSEKE